MELYNFSSSENSLVSYFYFFTKEVRLEGNVNLTGNSIYVDPTIMMGGKGIHITADEDVFIYGEDNWELNLNDLSENAITAGRNIVLAVGPGGKINLTGNTGKIFKAAGKVEIYADNVLLDEGVKLEDIIQASEIVKAGNKIIYHATMTGNNQAIGKAGQTIPVQFTIHNAGPKQDTYTLTAISASGLNISGLPSPVTIDGLKTRDFVLNVVLPMTYSTNDVITITVASQTDQTVIATMQISTRLQVFWFYVPNSMRNSEPIFFKTYSTEFKNFSYERYAEIGSRYCLINFHTVSIGFSSGE